MKTVAPFLLSFLLFSVGLYGQRKAQIYGTISTDDNYPAAYATLILNQAEDSAMVKAGTTDLDGNFDFVEVPSGKYRLNISYVGYRDYQTDVFELEPGTAKEMSNLVLTSQAEEISEIVVTALRPIVEVHPDKTVFNVDGSINATGNTALELLRKAPGVMVDNNDNIMLQGKSGVKVYIDGKPSPLSTADLANYLKSLQSSDIDAIEIITNPSAKYDAEGNAGIINIKLKKDKKLGANANINSSYRVGTYSKYNNSVSFNYRNYDLNVFGNYSNFTGKHTNFMHLYREQVGTGFDQFGGHISDNLNHNFRLGTDFFLSKKSTVGILVNGNLSNGNWSSNSRTLISPLLSGHTENVLLASNSLDYERNNLNFNLNYVYDNGNGTTMNIDGDFGRYRNGGESLQPNFYMNATEDALLEERVFFSLTPTDINIYTFKVDFEKNLGGGKFSAGAKYSRVETDNTYDFFDVIDDQRIRNIDRSNNFVYDENVNAGYVMFQKQIEKWNFSAGLRMEHTHSNGVLTSEKLIDNTAVERDYIDWFPSGGITFQVNDNHSVGINYSRRIDRPSYQDLNPFEYKLDELTFEKGNAFLTPQYTNSFSLTHTYKYKLNTTLSYSVTDDLITQITDTLDASATFITRVNLARQKTLSLTISYPFSVSKKWDVYANVSAFRTANTADFGSGKTIDIAANTVRIYTQNTFSLPHDFKLELSGFYNSPSLWGGNFEMDAMWGVDAGIQRKFFSDRATLKLAVTDIFHTQQWHGVNQFGGLSMDVSGRWESRQFRMSLSYLLGNNQVKASRKRSTGLEEEQRRIKSE
jgi:iron complex outermembrane receptor protein